MTKQDAIKIAEHYGMGFIRNEITREGCGVYLQSDRYIPELEKIAEKSLQGELTPCFLEAERGCGKRTTYRLYVPSDWIDLWGWAE